MKHFSSKHFLGGLIGCLILIVGVYLSIQSKTENPVISGKSQEDSTDHISTKGEGISKSLADDADPWEVWIKIQTDVVVEKFVDASAKKNVTFTNEQLVDLRRQARLIVIAAAEKEKKKSDIPPPVSESDVKVDITDTPAYNTVGKKHTGPQTVEALMDAFHTNYNKGKLSSEIDRIYPPQQWIQSILDRGLTIQNAAEYSEYMRIRWDLIDIENDPQFREMRSRGLGIPASDIEALKTAHLEKEIDYKRRFHNARRADERIHFVGLAGSNNETELPFYVGRTMTYVQRRSDSDYQVLYMGASLTEKQKFDLQFRGIEPEGIEIIYIDEMGKTLEEKPPPFKREEFRKMMEEGEKPPSKEWGNPNAPIPDSEEFLPPERTDTELDFRKQRAREEVERQAEEAAQIEFEQFIQEVRQLEKFATMSDAEIAAELEKQLRQQLLPGLPTEKSLEDALRENITPKPLTPERFNKAMQILQNHEPKEGLKRLAKDDPELAEYFRRNPQKVPPKRSQPSNSQDSQKE